MKKRKTPSSSSILLRRQLMSLDYPKVSLFPCKKTKSNNNHSSFRHRTKTQCTMKIGNGTLVTCAICGHTPSSPRGIRNQTVILEPQHRAVLLCTLLIIVPSEALVLCPICHTTFKALLRLEEEVEDLRARIRAVVKLRRLSEEHSSPPRPIAGTGTVRMDKVQPSTHLDDLHAEAGPIKEEPEPDEEEMADLMDLFDSEEMLGFEEPPEEEEEEVVTMEHTLLPSLENSEKDPLDLTPGTDTTLLHDDEDPPPPTPVPTSKVHEPQRSTNTRGKKQVCLICNLSFASDSLFQAHIHRDPTSDSGPGGTISYSFTCPTCGSILNSKKSFNYHMRTAHDNDEGGRGTEGGGGGKQGGQCQFCGKVFQYLRAHVKYCPSSSRPNGEFPTSRIRKFKCYFCDRSWAYSGNLHNHMRVHTLEKPYVCPKCGREFRENGNLKVHMVTVCGSDPEKRKTLLDKRNKRIRAQRALLSFVCDLCGKRFGCKFQLSVHNRRHHKN